MVEARAYFDKQGSLSTLNYLRALVILEVKSMKSSVVYTDIVTFIDRIDRFGSFKQIDIKMFICFYLCLFLFQRKIMAVGFLNFNNYILRRTENNLSKD